MTGVTATVVATPFNKRERIKEIPHTVKEATIKGFSSTADMLTNLWNKMPKALRYTLGFMAFVGVVFAWCMGCAYVIFGLLGYNVATIILYYMIAMGIPLGLMIAHDEG